MAIRYLLVLLAAGTLYGASCAPSSLWQDSGLIQYRVWHNDIQGFLGLAISHPLYYMIAIAAKYAGLGEFGHRVNLVSAVAAAVAVANLYLLMRLWLGKDLPALVAAVTFALSHTFWQHASIAETYTLWTALFLAELVMLLQYLRTRTVGWLYLLGLLNGLAIAVHMLACLPAVCYAAVLVALVARRAIRARDIAIVMALWILGALPYEYLIIRTLAHTGDIPGTLASAVFADRWRGDVLNTHMSWTLARENVLFAVLNFPTPNALLFFVGCYALHEIGPSAAFRNVLVALLLLFLVFAFRYTVADRYAFFIPFYGAASILIGLGTHTIRTRVRRRTMLYLIGAFCLLPIPVYAVAPDLAARIDLKLGTRGDIPYRNDYTYFLQPWKTGYDGAERFARAALESVERDAVICADTTTVGPLLYVQEVKGIRPDVSIVTGIVSSQGAPPYSEAVLEPLITTRPMYVTSDQPGYCPAFLLDRYDLAKAGVLWRVVRRQ